MDYTAHLDGALSRLHEEGRYRTFIDIEREKGNFRTRCGIARWQQKANRCVVWQ